MYYNTQQRVWDRMSQVYLGANRKVTVAYASDLDSARALQQDIISEIDAYDHIITGDLQRSVSVKKEGSEYAVRTLEYGIYVNGYDREKSGRGYIDDAVDNSLLDGYDVDIAI
jgi:hypothetical protein